MLVPLNSLYTDQNFEQNLHSLATISVSNFFDQCFDGYDTAVRHYNMFRSMYDRKAFTFKADSYIAFAGLLNRRLEYLLNLSANRQPAPSFDEIEKTIDLFVSLVSQATEFRISSAPETLNGTLMDANEFRQNDRIICCLLFYRIGDYQMALFKHTKKSRFTSDLKNADHLIYALCAYAAALDNITERRATLRPVEDYLPHEAVLLVELMQLISCNLVLENVARKFMETLTDISLPFHIFFIDEKEACRELENGKWPEYAELNEFGPEHKQLNFAVFDIWELCRTCWTFPQYNLHTLAKVSAGVFITQPAYLGRLAVLMAHDKSGHFLRVMMENTFLSNIKPLHYDDFELFKPENINGEDVETFFRWIITNCSLVWYSNIPSTQNLIKPKTGEDEERFGSIVFPYVLHRDVRVSDMIVWQNLCSLAFGSGLNPIYTDMFTTFFRKGRQVVQTLAPLHRSLPLERTESSVLLIVKAPDIAQSSDVPGPSQEVNIHRQEVSEVNESHLYDPTVINEVSDALVQSESFPLISQTISLQEKDTSLADKTDDTRMSPTSVEAASPVLLELSKVAIDPELSDVSVKLSSADEMKSWATADKTNPTTLLPVTKSEAKLFSKIIAEYKGLTTMFANVDFT